MWYQGVVVAPKITFMAAAVDPSPILPFFCKRIAFYYWVEFTGSSSSSSSSPASRSRVSYDSLLRRHRKRGLSLAVSSRGTSDVRVVDNNSNVHHNRPAFVEIPVTCYQILGISHKSEKDEIVKSVRHLKIAEMEEGYTMVAIASRQNLLMDVRDKLLFEADYAGNSKEKVPPKSSLQIPWSWLPAALCLLQEVGEEKLALDIGRTTLQKPDAKPYIHDLLLSMALAECAIAKASFEKSKISQGFEALARAQCLLKSKPFSEKITLLSQIEESLEELAPACTLELLGMPHTPENSERRLRAIAALRELLRRGLDVETYCQVQDWPCFLNQALNKLMAAEIVELLNWDSLANARKQKKSLESQNQRVVVDANCFYLVMMAHMALGFSSKQTEMIEKAKIICECLVASEGIDLKLEEAFCSFLLGQIDEAVAVERLQQVESNSNSMSRTLISAKDISEASNAKKLLESWLKNAVLGLFMDTRDSSPSLDNFFGGVRRVSENKHRKRASQTSSSTSHRSLNHAISSNWRTLGDHISSSPGLGPAAKQLTPSNLQAPRMAGDAETESKGSYPAVQLKRNLGAQYNRVWEMWLDPNNAVGYMSFVAAICILFATFSIMGQFWGRKRASRLFQDKPRINISSLLCATESSLGLPGSARKKGDSIVNRLTKLLSMQKKQLNFGLEAAVLQNSGLVSTKSSIAAVSRRPMHVEEAETLVKQWQTIKAEALGPNHQLRSLVDVLDESMLVQWQALAEAAKDRGCFWRFVLLQLSVLRAEILSDEIGKELAEIEALVEEAAELVDASPRNNPNYYSTYTIRYLLKRQDDSSWKFCEGGIQAPS